MRLGPINYQSNSRSGYCCLILIPAEGFHLFVYLFFVRFFLFWIVFFAMFISFVMRPDRGKFFDFAAFSCCATSRRAMFGCFALRLVSLERFSLTLAVLPISSLPPCPPASQPPCLPLPGWISFSHWSQYFLMSVTSQSGK